MTTLAPDVAEFLKGARVASLATVRPDGRPHMTPVWYEYDGYEFIVSTFRAAQKLRNVAKKGFAVLSVYTQDDDFTAISGIRVVRVWGSAVR